MLSGCSVMVAADAGSARRMRSGMAYRIYMEFPRYVIISDRGDKGEWRRGNRNDKNADAEIFFFKGLKTMKILIPCILDFKKRLPDRVHHLVRYLSQNHDITVVCVNEWWKGEEEPDTYVQKFRESLDSVTVQYITDAHMSPVQQDLDAQSLINTDILGVHDVIFNYNTLNSGQYIAKKLDIPMAYDIADDLPALIAHSIRSPGIFRLSGRRHGMSLIASTISMAKKVTATSQIFKESYSIPDHTFSFVPNGVDTDLFRKYNSSVREDLGIGDSFVLGYAGVFSEWVDFAPLLRAMKEINGTKLLILGEEERVKATVTLARKIGLGERVVCTGTVPYTKVPEYIAAMDACLLPFRIHPVSDVAVPLKLFEYMACEKPVISSNLSGIRNAVDGMIQYADTSEEFTSVITTLMDSPDERRRYSLHRDFVTSNYEWREIGRQVEGILVRCS